ncbi:MAG: ABC-F family ATP-binding cassette domain-containing protein [Firmicutes bacterium]|nr:ABC-F family ATP-binding cassette domain-containing protein [Bacillota bacterium]
MVLNEIGKYYGEQLVFSNVTASIAAKDRIGLVGANGVGKTTLLRIIAGLEYPDQGEINQGSTYRVGYLEQVLTNKDLLLKDYLEQAFADLLALKAQMKQLEQDLANPEIYNDPDQLEQVMAQYGRIQEQWEEQGGYNYQVELKNVLFGLGLSEFDLDKTLSQLSGGQQIRAQLGRLLLEKPDLLLLDEPTNHLDTEAIQWLESFLPSFPNAIIVVSHDRYFLDRVATRIWEIADQQLYQYRGNYTEYQKARNLRIAQHQEARAQQEAEIAKMEAFIRKFGAGTRARQAKSLEKRLEKMERLQGIETDHSFNFTFKSARQTGERVLDIECVSKSFDKPVLKEITGQIKRGDRIALIGPNGCGKSTLLKILAGELDYQGQLKWGANVDIGYFAQDIPLEHKGTVLDELYETHRLDLGVLRNVLARFLFKGDDVFKAVAVLSGGERNRLVLAKLLLAAPNFLILDEPTNHLDIYGREALEKALLDYGGTIIFTSHDRYFVDLLATKLWVMENGRVQEFIGSLSQYLEQQKVLAAQARAKKEAQTRASQQQRKQAQQRASNRKNQERLAKLEEKIFALEEEQARLDKLLASEELYQDQEKSKATVLLYNQIQQELVDCYEVWESLIDD